MTPMIWSWILSVAGAALFFSAGAALTARRRAGVGMAQGAASTLDLRSGLEAAPNVGHSGRPGGLPIPAPQISMAPSDVAPSDAQSDAARAALSECQTRLTGLERELERSTRDRTQLASELELERKRAAQEREDNSAELRGLQGQLQAASARGDNDARTAALEHELAMSQESLRARDVQLEQLREETARLRRLEEELARTKHELATQAEQMRVARSQAYSGKTRPRRPSTPDLPISAHVRELQTIVDAETRTGRAKSAVIADELGLLVASSGTDSEYVDALAAMGAYLADVGTKTRDVLPLHKVLQVVVRDEHDVTLTVRPLTADDPGLALVTLAIEPTSMARTETRKN